MITGIPDGAYWLVGGRVPGSLLTPNPTLEQDREGLVAVDLRVEQGIITAVVPAGSSEIVALPPETIPVVDLAGGLVWPCFVDIHTHLDKGHVWPRQQNPEGTFDSALQRIYQDRQRWTEDDLYQRIQFGLRCSYAHGTQAVRTHLDCGYAEEWVGWKVWQQLQKEWAGKIALQGVSLVETRYFRSSQGERIADQLATGQGHGILGGVTFPHPELDDDLAWMIDLAQERGLDLDFHCDETRDPSSLTLRQVAAAVLAKGFTGRVVCGHCCNLTLQDPETLGITMDLVKAAGIGIISLPMCNLYLQDRQVGRTPRWRGVTALQELAHHGIPVALASDNCRDPFYGFGDHDVLEVFQMGVRIGHLDTPYGQWPAAVTSTPATLMGMPEIGRIAIGSTADLVLFQGRSFSELLSRSQHDRIVLRQGKPIDTTLPDYRELDVLLC